MERAVWRGRTLLGLVAYSLCLVGIAYACAATERGVSLPWVVFFAPFSGVSRLVGWDRSAPVVITMFVGAAALWPALWLCVRVSPGAHQKVVGEAMSVSSSGGHRCFRWPGLPRSFTPLARSSSGDSYYSRCRAVRTQERCISGPDDEGMPGGMQSDKGVSRP
jgi:hypothetical protein